MTITTDQIIAVAGVIGALGVIWAVVSKPFKAIEELKKSVDDLTKNVTDMQDDLKMNGDMVYQLLNHASTKNNTGEMQRALNQYNEYFRH